MLNLPVISTLLLLGAIIIALLLIITNEKIENIFKYILSKLRKTNYKRLQYGTFILLTISVFILFGIFWNDVVAFHSDEPQIVHIEVAEPERHLSDEQKETLITNLSTTTGCVAISCPIADAESCAFGIEIQQVFDDSGWDVARLNYSTSPSLITQLKGKVGIMPIGEGLDQHAYFIYYILESIGFDCLFLNVGDAATAFTSDCINVLIGTN